jgi:NAD(P)-dependent dehydrogenase (short-subunit alcohol dehydrogenase family)
LHFETALRDAGARDKHRCRRLGWSAVEVRLREIFGLVGEPALVVGGGYGSGRLTALLLARAGAKVAVADIDADRARSVAAEVGGTAITADVTTEAGASRAVDEACAALGGLTRLANIVGLVRMSRFLDSDPAQWQQQLQLNLIQHMLICRAAGPHMQKAGRGSIAMVSSVSGLYGARDQAAYGIAKAGVMSLARTLAEEWGACGVRVNTVAPDITATPRVRAAVPGSEIEVLARFDAMAAREGVPLRRFGRTHEIAGPLLFLLSDLSSYMTGQTLVVDGGTRIRFPHATSLEAAESVSSPPQSVRE